MTNITTLPLKSWCHTTTKPVQVSTHCCVSYQSQSVSSPAKVHVRSGYPLSKESLQKPLIYFWILCVTYTARTVHWGAMLLQYFCCRALKAGAAQALISLGELPPQKWCALERWTEETYQDRGFWSNVTITAAWYISAQEKDVYVQRRTQQHSLWCHKKPHKQGAWLAEVLFTEPRVYGECKSKSRSQEETV